MVRQLTAAPPPPKSVGGPGTNILVVDDEAPIRGMLVRWLSSAGYTPSAVASAEEAAAALRRSPPPLMTVDITLPGRSGLELLDQVKAEYQDTEVIMLTAMGQTDTAISALTRGASGYLIKPVAQEELLFQVRRALQRRQLLIDRRLYTEQLEARVRDQTISIRKAHEETIYRLVTASMYRDEETGRTSAAWACIAPDGRSAGLVLRRRRTSADGRRHARHRQDRHPRRHLEKPGGLTPDEFEIMKQHTTIGADAHRLRFAGARARPSDRPVPSRTLGRTGISRRPGGRGDSPPRGSWRSSTFTTR